MADENLKWMEEKIEKLPYNNCHGLYRLLCFCLFKRRMSYKEFYALLVKLNRKRIGEEGAKKFALISTLATYKFNNNFYPKELPHG